MTAEPENDGDANSRRAPPDAHGQAALILSESLLHALIEKGILAATEGVELVEDAARIQGQVRTENPDDGREGQRAAALLTTMAASLRLDLFPSNRPS